MAIPSAPNKHNNLYQSTLKGAVLSLQNMTLHYEIPCKSDKATSNSNFRFLAYYWLHQSYEAALYF